MSENYPGEIHIGGTIPEALLDRLVKTIMAEGVSLDDYGGPPATLEELRKAFQEGRIVRLYDDQAQHGQFEDLEAFLVEHRVHFDRQSDAYCEYDGEKVCYRGGKEPLYLPVDHAGTVLLRLEELEAVLDDTDLDDHSKVEAIRKLTQPTVEELAPIRFE